MSERVGTERTPVKGHLLILQVDVVKTGTGKHLIVARVLGPGAVDPDGTDVLAQIDVRTEAFVPDGFVMVEER